MQPIDQVRGRGVPLISDDIDTDRIIPARFMKCVTFDGLGEFAFFDSRFEEDGTPKAHPLNEPRFQDATILLSGSNFGCGSSREHAPQSLYRYGFRGVIAESFAEIFFGNSITLGMPCVTVAGDDLKAIAERVRENPAEELTIDILNHEIRAGDNTWPCAIPDSAREALLSGRYDPISDLLEGGDEVDRLAGTLVYLKS